MKTLTVKVDDNVLDALLAAELQNYHQVLKETESDETLSGIDRADASSTMLAIVQILSHYMLSEDFDLWMKTKS